MSKKQKNNGSNSILELVRNNSVPLMFIIICAVCIPISGFSPGYLLNEIVTRLGRNAFLILSLLIPIMAGMGLNFGMTLGAMAGEIGLIFVADWQIWGIPGIILAMIISIPISILLGLFCGKMLNMAKGRGDGYQLYHQLLHEWSVSAGGSVHDGFHYSDYPFLH